MLSSVIGLYIAVNLYRGEARLKVWALTWHMNLKLRLIILIVVFVLMVFFITQ